MTGLPTLVSFYAGDAYYYEAAQRLKNDCERLGMPYFIEEIEAEGLDWGQICRLKIDFYRRMHGKFGAILWVDADTRLLATPELLRDCRFDLAGFGGRYRYIRDYDPYESTRFWVPSVLYFGATDKAARFIEMMDRVEKSADNQVTDDWVLHETWMTHEEQLSVALLPPGLIVRDAGMATAESVFVHGDSGNVSSFRGQVVQHQRRVDNPLLRSKILGAEAMDAMKSGDKDTAVRLAQRSVAAQPGDPAATVRLSRYLKLSGRSTESQDVLGEYLERLPGEPAIREELLKRQWEQKDYAGCRTQLRHLLLHDDASVRARAESIADDVSRDERAAAAGIPDSARVSMWWVKTPYPGKIGDIVSPWIVEKVSGAPVKFGRRESSLLAVGSIIKFATGESTVWGSGTSRSLDRLSSDATYKAVRGPLTRDVVLASGGACPPVYGDPALLLPRYLPRPERRPSFKLGFIRDVSQSAKTLRFDGVKDIDLHGAGQAAIERVVDDIVDCEMILSTSLHGIIIANAYGIPARWCNFGDDAGLEGDGMKFADYFLSVGLPLQTAHPLDSREVIGEYLARLCPTSVDIEFDEQRLIDAFHS
jgi:Polysaccharide pyruvyl transferase